jgi:hypothetical protein
MHATRIFGIALAAALSGTLFLGVQAGHAGERTGSAAPALASAQFSLTISVSPDNDPWE